MTDEIDNIEETEEEESPVCPSCDRTRDSLGSCESCHEGICSSCLNDCNECGSDYCDECLTVCISCDHSICSDCYISCYNCGENICSSCQNYSENDDHTYCSSCYEEIENGKNNCGSLTEFSDNPRMLEHDCKPEWTFHKEAYENTLYLGVELETEFNNDKEQTFFDITKKYLEDKHIWKQDGSLECGGELVITPHTLLAYKKIDLRNMLKDMQSNGAQSFDAERCGLHIHVNKNELEKEDIDKIQLFFSRNKGVLKKFTQRTSSTLERWANIPTWETYTDNLNAPWKHQLLNIVKKYNDRYVAVNTQNDETIEFRLFRGTLDYKRFKATLHFVDAICHFVKLHGTLACCNEESWTNFLTYLEQSNRYIFLLDYLKNKNLLKNIKFSNSKDDECESEEYNQVPQLGDSENLENELNCVRYNPHTHTGIQVNNGAIHEWTYVPSFEITQRCVEHNRELEEIRDRTQEIENRINAILAPAYDNEE